MKTCKRRCKNNANINFVKSCLTGLPAVLSDQSWLYATIFAQKKRVRLLLLFGPFLRVGVGHDVGGDVGGSEWQILRVTVRPDNVWFHRRMAVRKKTTKQNPKVKSLGKKKSRAKNFECGRWKNQVRMVFRGWRGIAPHFGYFLKKIFYAVWYLWLSGLDHILYNINVDYWK